MSLAEETEAFAAQGRINPDPERMAIYAKAQRAVEATDILETALGVGDAAPMFTLPDAHGNAVSLADILANGPVVLSFYRGAWCPFCNLELAALQREVDSASAQGITLVAVSPNTPDVTTDLVAKHALTYPVLSDKENAVAKQFKLVFEMEEGLVDYYRNHDRDIAGMNGSEVWELPVPATYVIDQGGVIRYAYVNLNHRERAEPSEVVAVAASLAG